MLALQNASAGGQAVDMELLFPYQVFFTYLTRTV